MALMSTFFLFLSHSSQFVEFSNKCLHFISICDIMLSKAFSEVKSMRSAHENQQKILDFIKKEIEQKGYPPSVREICVGVGLKSTSTVHAHLNHLEGLSA